MLTAPTPRDGRAPGPQHGRAHLMVPTLATGALMLLYLLARPYGDVDDATRPEAARAFASTWWVVAHLAGAFALASYAVLAVRLADVAAGAMGSVGRRLALVGVVLVLPYFGAETFALHVIGREALAGSPGVLGLVDSIRDQPVAVTMFGLGLLCLALSAVVLALVWQRSGATPLWSLWPLATGVVLFLPHFFLAPAGRMAFGIAYAVAAGIFARGLARDLPEPISGPGPSTL